MCLCHESLATYYKNNNRLLFRPKGEFDQLITLTVLEEMLPYERTLYFILINQRIQEREQQKGMK